MSAPKPLLNTHVFGQSKFNWLPLPAEVGKTIEIPIPPVEGLTEVLVFVSATSNGPATGPQYFAVFCCAIDGGPVPYHYLFLAGGNAEGGSATNSDNFWLRLPDKGLPRVVHIQKMYGDPLPASDAFTSGVALLALR